MLALSRGEGQSIIIDGQIEIKVVKWTRSSVRLAIQAPREVSIDRDEVWRRLHPGAKSPLEEVEFTRALRDACEADRPGHSQPATFSKAVHRMEPARGVNGFSPVVPATQSLPPGNGQSLNGSGEIK